MPLSSCDQRRTVELERVLIALLLLTLVVQDRVLADRIQSDGRACVVVCNKWDLVKDKNDASYNKVLACSYMPLVVLKR